MVRRLTFIVVIMLALVAMTVGSTAQEGDSNWCSDGPWAGTCNEVPEYADWLWICGWYFAQAEAGVINLFDAPCGCLTLLPNSDSDPIPDIADQCPLDGTDTCTWGWTWQQWDAYWHSDLALQREVWYWRCEGELMKTYGLFWGWWRRVG